MFKIFKKLAKRVGIVAEKIGVVVEPGGILRIENFNMGGWQKPSRPSQEKDLIAQVCTEVYSRLNPSTYSQFIKLEKELHPELVVRPWDLESKLGVKGNELLPEQTTTLDLFSRQQVGGKLLILGNPGAGKTMTLVGLAKSLLEEFVEADPTYPIPVLLDLSSWRNENLSKWLLAAVKEKYSISGSLGKRWITEKKLLLLIDGLDELKAELQESCVKAINSFLGSELRPKYAVICCRSETYSQLNCRLKLNMAVRLRPLSASQVESYLCEINQHDFWSELSQDSRLLGVISTPLMLRVISVTYPKISRAELEQIKSTEGIPSFLWDLYIAELLESASASKTYSNTKSVPSEKTVRRWLTWLARVLEKESKTEFLIEKLQPACLPSNLRRVYQWRLKVLKGLAGGIFFFIASGLAGTLFEDSNLQIFLALFGLVVSVISAASAKEKMTVLVSEAFRWSWSRACLGLLAGSVIFFSGQKVLNILNWASIRESNMGLSIVFLAGLMQGITASEIEDKSLPNQGMWRTAKVSFAKMLLIGITSGFIAGVYFHRTLESITGLAAGIFMGTGFSLIWLLFDIAIPPKRQGSTENCVKHFLIRRIIARQGFAPWNYAQFLAYTSEKVILQRVGGRYRFIHKQLQEHFAAMPLD